MPLRRRITIAKDVNDLRYNSLGHVQDHRVDFLTPAISRNILLSNQYFTGSCSSGLLFCLGAIHSFVNLTECARNIDVKENQPFIPTRLTLEWCIELTSLLFS